MGLKEKLKQYLSEEELKKAPSSFEIIGSREGAVAIVEIDSSLENKKNLIAECIRKLHKNVKTVLRKRSKRKGEYRLRDFEFLIEGPTEVIHKEHGYLIKVDPTKVYFSAREATERQRIAEKVEEGEEILIMFSGVAPFAIAIAKKRKKVKIYCVEANEAAHKYATENIKINKLEGKIIALKGRVEEICKGFGEEFDRILMPLPERAWDFLELAIKCLKKRGIIHFYAICKEDLAECKSKLETLLEELKVKFKIKEIRKVLPYAPRKWKVCFDIEILKF